MHKLKKMLTGLLAAACLTAALPAAFAAEPAFTNVPAGSEYAAAVKYVTENGLMQGYGNGLFGANDTLATGQLNLILRRYAEEDVQWTGGNGTPTSITRGRLAQIDMRAPSSRRGPRLRISSSVR